MLSCNCLLMCLHNCSSFINTRNTSTAPFAINLSQPATSRPRCYTRRNHTLHHPAAPPSIVNTEPNGQRRHSTRHPDQRVIIGTSPEPVCRPETHTPTDRPTRPTQQTAYRGQTKKAANPSIPAEGRPGRQHLENRFFSRSRG